MGKTINELKDALSLMNRMGIVNENSIKDKMNILEGEGIITNPEELAMTFENMKPEEGWKMSFGYITAAEKVYGNRMNARFKGHGFSDAQKDSVRGFNDEDLNNYMGDESKFRGGKYELYKIGPKKGEVKNDTLYVKNPYKPDGNTTYLFSYKLITANFTSSSGRKYKEEKNTRDNSIKDVIRNNPNMVKDYLEANSGNPKFEEEYNNWIAQNPNGSQIDFIIDKFTKGRPDDKYKRMGKVTPFYRNTDTNQISLRSYYSKPTIQYSRTKFFVYNPDTKTIKEISEQQASAISSMFVSDAKQNEPKELTELEKSIQALKDGSNYVWESYLANQIVTMKFSYYDENDEVRHVEYQNRDAVVRYVNDKKNKVETYTEPGALKGFDNIYTEEEE